MIIVIGFVCVMDMFGDIVYYFYLFYDLFVVMSVMLKCV